MDSRVRVVHVPSVAAVGPALRSSNVDTPSVGDGAFALAERLSFPSSAMISQRDYVTLASRLNTISKKHAHFFQSVGSCVLASCQNFGKTNAAVRAVDAPQSQREGGRLGEISGWLQKKGPAVSTKEPATTTAANATTPDLESYWLATSPFPPTAVLAALYSLLPLCGVSVANRAEVIGKAAKVMDPEGSGADIHDTSAAAVHATQEMQAMWSLCRYSASQQRGLSFWEAFAMTAAAVHTASGTAARESSNSANGIPASSASSFSLAEQLRRAAAAVDGASAPSPPAAVTLLEWPEEFLWCLLGSLLSALALVHSAGLHFFGQLTAADVLCFSCTSSTPRLLEETWEDVAAAADADSPEEAVALFRQFYATVVPSVLLTQATLTPETPCHNAFFVLQPSIALLSRRTNAATGEGCEPAKDAGRVTNAEADRMSDSAAQESADETPEQQARYQAADLASVGRLLTTILELRARWAAGGQPPPQEPQLSRPFSKMEATSAGRALPAAHPSSELVFLVRRLCECEAATGDKAAASSPAPQRGFPTALQLLQLQALRLRTEAWYYRRLAAEACDRLAATQPQHHQQQSQKHARQQVLDEVGAHTSSKERDVALKEAELRRRESAVAEREAKLDLILRVYELSHEHLDAVPLPDPQKAPFLSATGKRVQHEMNSEKNTPPRPREQHDNSLEMLLLGGPLAAKQRGGEGGGGGESRPDDATSPPLDVSGDGLLGLSPLPRLSLADDVDATLLSASATPYAAFQGAKTDDTSAAVADKDAAMKASSATRRQLDVGEPALPAAHQYTVPFSFVSPQPQFSTATVSRLEDMSAQPTVVEVEVELGDVSDAEHSVGEKKNPPPFEAAAAMWNAAAVRTAPDVIGTTLQSLPGLLPSSSLSPTAAAPAVATGTPEGFSPTTYLPHHLRTPVRAPALPNMGAVDADMSGMSMKGNSHSKYSALGLLRTPPSARRPGTGGTRREASHSPSPHSPESYRSSTRPYTNAVPVTAATTAGLAIAATTTVDASQRGARESPSQRSSRRRSGSRGSSGANLDKASSNAIAAGVDGAPAHSPSSTGADSATESTAWARQQLSELQNMQTALRAQQPATPRNRASSASAKAAPSAHAPSSAAVAAAAGNAASDPLRTPERQPSRSPGSSPYQEPEVYAALSTPPSQALQSSPARHTAVAGRSPLDTDGSRSRSRSRSSSGRLRAHSSQLRDPRSAEKPVYVQGASWSAGAVQRTPLSSRRPNGRDAGQSRSPLSPPVKYVSSHSAAAPRPVPVLTGRTSPPAKPGGNLATSPTPFAASAGRSNGGNEVLLSPPPPLTTRTAHAAPHTAAALSAALRTPPRQTVSASAALPSTREWEAVEVRHRLVNPFHTTHLTPPSFTPSYSVAAAVRDTPGSTTATASSARSARRPATASSDAGVSGRDGGAAAVRCSSRPFTGAASPAVDVGAAARPAHRVQSARGGVRELPSNAAEGLSARMGKGSRSSGPRVASGGAPSASSVTVPSSTPGKPATGASALTKGQHAPRAGGTPSAMELLRRLRASSNTAAAPS